MAQVVLAFSLAGGEDDGQAVYRVGLAVSGILVYAFLIGLTFLAAGSFLERKQALGLVGASSRWLWLALAVAVAALAVAALLEPALPAGEEQGLVPDAWRGDRTAQFAANAVVIVLLGPFAEELFYRGLGVSALSFLGGAAAVSATALAWSLAHGLLVAIPALFVLGIGLGWLRLRSASVLPAVLAHSVYNGLALGSAFLT